MLVVDDTVLHCRVLADALAAEASIDAVETATDAAMALALLPAAGTTIVLVNMGMGDGAAVVDSVVRAMPAAPVIALAVADLEDEIIACVEAGVVGCLLKGDSYSDLVELIGGVAQGELRCSPRVTAALLHRVTKLSRMSRQQQARPVPGDALLTAREWEVMQLIDAGLSNQQIAHRLSIELRTVKNHVHHILVKYQVHHRAEAAAMFRSLPQHDDGHDRSGSGILPSR
ncbi:MAG: response regulator transcription factor [Catenulisporales bacterium]|nr:response regulator transcription factor [Catenulisporales bacterium]